MLIAMKSWIGWEGIGWDRLGWTSECTSSMSTYGAISLCEAAWAVLPYVHLAFRRSEPVFENIGNEV